MIQFLLPLLIIAGAIWLIVRLTQGKSKTPMSLMRRYGDAYLVARVTITVGKVVKGISIIIAAVGIFSAMGIQDQLKGDLDSRLALAISLLMIIVGAFLYCVGVLISAQGQVLLASLDSAVNSSPLLTSEDKARIILGEYLVEIDSKAKSNSSWRSEVSTASSISGVEIGVTRDQAAGQNTQIDTQTAGPLKCPACGAIIRVTDITCPDCELSLQ